METDEVVVIGAGTAGLIAAKSIAAHGIKVTVYDRKEKLGYPVKASGVISIRGLESLRISYKKAVTNDLYGAIIHTGRESFTVHAEKPVAHVVDRLILNEICYDECLDAGASVKKGIGVSSAMLDKFSKKSIIVGADGAVSTVAKHFGFPPIEKYVLTFKAEYRTMEDSENVELFFDNNVTPGFFGWIIPKGDGTIEVGVGIDSKRGNSKHAFDSFVRTKYVAEQINGKEPRNQAASIIPVMLRKKFVDEEKKVLLVGDAAGQVKASTGGGIVLGGNAAIMVGNAVYEHISHGKQLVEYEKAWRQKFGRDIAMHSMVRNFYSRSSLRSLAFAMKTAKKLGFESLLSKYGDMDSPSLIIKRVFLRKRN